VDYDAQQFLWRKLRCGSLRLSFQPVTAWEELVRKASLLAALFSAVLSLPGFALAAPITVHNTGVNASDVLVAPGAQASFWTLSAEPAEALEAIGSNPFRYFNVAYFADTATAAWVAPQGSGNAGLNGIYTYDLVIDLTGFNPATASIVGTFGTDNDGSISLNSNPLAATTGVAAFGAPTPFTINSGLVAGLNTIHVQVDNLGDPTAFFVSFTSASATASAVQVPVPAMSWSALAGLALLLAGLGSLLARRAWSP
jgi:hypothetical protein